MRATTVAGDLAIAAFMGLLWLVALCADVLLLTLAVWATGHYVFGFW